MKRYKNVNGTVSIYEEFPTRKLVDFTMPEVHALVLSGEWDLSIFEEWYLANFQRATLAPNRAEMPIKFSEGQLVQVSLSGKPGSWELRKFAYHLDDGKFSCYVPGNMQVRCNWNYCRLPL